MAGTPESWFLGSTVTSLALLLLSAYLAVRAIRRLAKGTRHRGTIIGIEGRELTAAYVQPMTARYNGFVSYKVKVRGTSDQVVLLRSYIPRLQGDHVSLVQRPGAASYSFVADLFLPAAASLGFALFAAVAAVLLRYGPF